MPSTQVQCWLVVEQPPEIDRIVSINRNFNVTDIRMVDLIFNLGS